MPINYLAVLLSALVVTLLGALWYGPLFGKTWIKLMHWTEKEIEAAKKKGMAQPMIINFLSTLVYILAWLLNTTSPTSLTSGITLAFLVWLGFIATITLSTVLWEGKPFKLYLLNNLYNLISLIITSLILTAWV
jgi:hypothetical protein